MINYYSLKARTVLPQHGGEIHGRRIECVADLDGDRCRECRPGQDHRTVPARECAVRKFFLRQLERSADRGQAVVDRIRQSAGSLPVKWDRSGRRSDKWKCLRRRVWAGDRKEPSERCRCPKSRSGSRESPGATESEATVRRVARAKPWRRSLQGLDRREGLRHRLSVPWRLAPSGQARDWKYAGRRDSVFPFDVRLQ